MGTYYERDLALWHWPWSPGRDSICPMFFHCEVTPFYTVLSKGKSPGAPSPYPLGAICLFHYMVFTTAYVPGTGLATRDREACQMWPLPSGNWGFRMQGQRGGLQPQRPVVSAVRRFHRSTKEVPSLTPGFPLLCFLCFKWVFLMPSISFNHKILNVNKKEPSLFPFHTYPVTPGCCYCLKHLHSTFHVESIFSH